MTSPAFKLARAHVYATRLIDSVALRVNTISRGSRAWTKPATLPRAASNAAVASSAIV